MRPRTINLSVSVMGMARMTIATITVKKFADIRKAATVLICPDCGEKPAYSQEYACMCGAKYHHWGKLNRIIKATKTIIEKVRLIPEKETVNADLYRLSIEDFGANYVDATFPKSPEYGVIVKDEASARNLKKLIIASEKLNKVILVKYNDTYEEVICVLMLSLSSRIILKNIIPMNLLDIEETMRVNVTDLTAQQLAEAEAFVQQLPEATPDLLNVSDYRTIGVDEPEAVSKVMELEEILARAST